MSLPYIYDNVFPGVSEQHGGGLSIHRYQHTLLLLIYTTGQWDLALQKGLVQGCLLLFTATTVGLLVRTELQTDKLLCMLQRPC